MVRCKLFDPEPLCLREKATQLQFNQIEPRNQDRRLTLFQKLIGSFGERCEILSPFECDYGSNCTIGDDSFINREAYLMDGAPIHISKRCFIGPDLGTYTARHPLLPKERDSGFERAFPITIGTTAGSGETSRSFRESQLAKDLQSAPKAWSTTISSLTASLSGPPQSLPQY